MESSRQKKEVLMRLKRIEGQLRGVQRMVEQGISCSDVLTQMAAATAAMKKAGMAIVEGYMDECLEKSRQETASKRTETLREFQKAMARYMDWA